MSDSNTLSYTLAEELGSGALARVVRVVGPKGEAYAGKILHTSREADATAAQRFAQEAQIVSGLEHANIARVFGRKPIAGHDVLLMELVEGGSLADLAAREGTLDWRRVAGLAQGIAAGLVHAHERGVIHRDLKPANVLLDGSGNAKIVDFGMARATSFAGVDPEAFAILGTPDYMAPETLDPLAVDVRSDLYALGCIVYELLTGWPPYSSATAFGLLEQHRIAPVPELGPPCPPRLGALVQRLLAKEPSLRPQSAAAVVEELELLRDSGSELAVVAGDTTLATVYSGKCARCGTSLVEGLDVCLECGLSSPSIEAGPFTVFVTGPGRRATKLDVALRADLLAWIEGNPNIGLNAKELANRIPRLPFPLVVGVSPASAQALEAAVRELGLETATRKGGHTALPAIRRKALTMGGRGVLIAAGMSIYMVNQMGAIWWMWPMVWLATLTAMGGWSLRAVTKLSQRGRAALPPVIAQALKKVSQVGPTLRAPRHREALRGVVASALALRSSTAGAGSGATDIELGKALELALVAAGRLDALDAQLEGADLRQASAQLRGLLTERDTWSARMLELSASLETLRARLIRAQGRKATADRSVVASVEAETLAVLRAKIEALEEVNT